MAREAKVIHEMPLPKGTEHGCFVAPAAYEISGIDVLERDLVRLCPFRRRPDERSALAIFERGSDWSPQGEHSFERKKLRLSDSEMAT
jgi:hypothetical protein